MKKPNEKLTGEQIAKIESWAEDRKNRTNITDAEKNMITAIENLKKNDWEGCRINENRGKAVTNEEARVKLERLKKKV